MKNYRGALQVTAAAVSVAAVDDDLLQEPGGLLEVSDLQHCTSTLYS